MRHEEDEEEEGGGRKGGRKEGADDDKDNDKLGFGGREDEGENGKEAGEEERGTSFELSRGDLNFVPLFLNSGAQGSITSKRGAPSFQGLCRVFAGGTLQRPCKDPAKLESCRPLGA